MGYSLVASSSQFLKLVYGGGIPTGSMPITINCWFRINDLTSVRTLVSLVDESASNSWFSLNCQGTTSGDPIRAEMKKGFFTRSAKSTAGYNTGSTWQMATATFTSTTSRSAFYNGANKGSNTFSGSAPTGLDAINIGRLGDSSPSQYHDGDIAEVSIWNRVLSDLEIQRLFDNKLGGRTTQFPSLKHNVRMI